MHPWLNVTRNTTKRATLPTSVHSSISDAAMITRSDFAVNRNKYNETSSNSSKLNNISNRLEVMVNTRPTVVRNAKASREFQLLATCLVSVRRANMRVGTKAEKSVQVCQESHTTGPVSHTLGFHSGVKQPKKL